MRNTKIFYGNQYVESFKCDGKKYTKFQLIKFRAARAAKRTMAVTAIMLTGVWLIVGGMFYAKAKIVSAKEIVIVPVTKIAPVMERIAKCESGGTHTKNGQVIFNANTNRTVDIGKYQINSIWSKQATEMELDLTKEKDNEAFALYLYENYGTEPWYSSAKCWNK